MESWINAEMGLQAQNFEIPEQAWKFTHAVGHVDFPDRNVYRKTILSDGKFQCAPTFLQKSLLCETFTNSSMLFQVTAWHGVMAIFCIPSCIPRMQTGTIDISLGALGYTLKQYYFNHLYIY